MQKLLSLFLISCLLLACEGKNEEVVVARVYNEKLFASELSEVALKAESRSDSVNILNAYINNWVRERLLLHKAEQNLPPELKDVEDQLENYRKSLIVYAYEKEVVRQLLDTNVTEKEIVRYYEENQKDFELKNNIIKVLYVKVDKEAPKINKLKDLYRSTKPKDRVELEEYCHKYASNFYLDDNTWLLFDDLLKEIPIKTYNEELFLKNNRYLEVEDSLNLYLLNIKGFRIKNTASPLTFEKKNIRNIILNKRKLDLLARMKKDIYTDAVNSNEVEIKEFNYEDK